MIVIVAGKTVKGPVTITIPAEDELVNNTSEKTS